MNNQSQLTSEVVMVTPEMAAIWLERNKNNRNINFTRVALYAKEMQQGRWMLHHQGVAFYDDGSFADGQHRLHAIVKSGCTVEMNVTRGVPKSSGLMIDTHQQRQTHQSIKISGLADWIGKDEVAVIRLIYQIESKNNGAVKKVSHSEIINIGEKYKSSIQFAIALKTKTKKSLSGSVSLTAIATASAYEDKNRLSEFYDVLISGMPESSSDKAAILLREWFLQEKTGANGGAWRTDAVKRSMRAIKAFCANEEIGKLYQPKDFIYKPVPDVQTREQS